MSDTTKMTNAELAEFVSGFIAWTDRYPTSEERREFMRRRDEAARRLREDAAKIAEVEQDRDVAWADIAVLRVEVAKGRAATAEREVEECGERIMSLLGEIDRLQKLRQMERDAARAERERLKADLETCMDALERLKQPTVGPAILTHICEAGRNEIEYRREIAEKAQTSTHQWRDAEAALTAQPAPNPAPGDGGGA